MPLYFSGTPPILVTGLFGSVLGELESISEDPRGRVDPVDVAFLHSPSEPDSGRSVISSDCVSIACGPFSGTVAEFVAWVDAPFATAVEWPVNSAGSAGPSTATPSAETARCDRCTYWFLAYDEARTGVCQRLGRAGSEVTISDPYTTISTPPGHHCGEFKPAP